MEGNKVKLTKHQEQVFCNHVWIVYSTALIPPCLMLKCKKCETTGTVHDSTSEEWGEGFYAPRKPYEWRGGNDRVKED